MNSTNIDHRGGICCLFVLVLFALPISAFSEELVFHLSHDDYKPFHWYDENNQSTKGIFVDIVEEVFSKRLGCKVVYHQYPWKRAQMMVESGREDAFITTPTIARLKYTVVGKVPFFIMRKVVFTYPDNPRLEQIKHIQTIEDLRPFVVLDYLGNGWAESRLVNEHNLSIAFSTEIDNVLEKIALKRGDVFIEDPRLFSYNIRLLGLEGAVVETSVILDTSAYKLCFSKQSPFVRMMPQIDQALLDMRNDGTLENILDKWQ